MKAKAFDEQFEKGEDVTRYLDLSKAKRPDCQQKRVNVDFPVWMIHSLDREAHRLGVTRQSVIKLWLADKLKEAVAKVPNQLFDRDGSHARRRVKSTVLQE